MSTLALLVVLASPPPTPVEPAATQQSVPTPEYRFPDGRLEFAARGGYMIFDKKMALKPRPTIGGEFAHHFQFDNRLFGLGAFVTAEGALTEITGTNSDVDVIALSVGMMFSYRAHAKVMPTLRMGSGFVLVDGTKSGLPIRGRSLFNAGLGVRYFPIKWLVLRAHAGLIAHDNVQIRAGSGQFGTAANWLFTAGIGVVR